MLSSDDAYGNWPASGEIDLMENVGWQEAGRIHCTLHTDARNHRKKNQVNDQLIVPDAHDAYHVYALEWTPDDIKLFVDNQLVLAHHNKTTEGDPEAWREWPFDRRFHILLNVAIGGSWGNEKGVDDAAFPCGFDVAYVHVFKDRDVEKSIAWRSEIAALRDSLDMAAGPAGLESLGWSRLSEVLDDLDQPARGSTADLAERLFTYLGETNTRGSGGDYNASFRATTLDRDGH